MAKEKHHNRTATKVANHTTRRQGGRMASHDSAHGPHAPWPTCDLCQKDQAEYDNYLDACRYLEKEPTQKRPVVHKAEWRLLPQNKDEVVSPEKGLSLCTECLARAVKSHTRSPLHFDIYRIFPPKEGKVDGEMKVTWDEREAMVYNPAKGEPVTEDGELNYEAWDKTREEDEEEKKQG